MNRIAKLATIALTAVPALAYSQSALTAPKFEVASIKPCSANVPGNVFATPARLTVNCMALRGLIDTAYVLYSDGTLHLPGRTIVPVERAPAWVTTDLYTIEAKVEGTPTLGMIRGPLLQSLLEDRFKLKIRSENRDAPVYALTVAKDGPKLQPAQPGSCRPIDFDNPPPPPPRGQTLQLPCKLGRITNDAYEVLGVTMPEFAVDLSRRLDRDVIDRTAVAGTFDIHVALTPGLAAQLLAGLLPPPPPPGAAGAPPNPAEPADTFGAIQAIVQKLGLKLEPAKGPSRLLVIDHIEKPSDN